LSSGFGETEYISPPAQSPVRWWQYYKSFRSKTNFDKTPRLTQTFSKAKLNRMFHLGYKLAFETTKPKKKDWEDIYSLWLCAAKGGHKRAQFYLGTCYDHGYGTDNDLHLAFEWYLKAAKAGHRDAQYNVGFFFATGELGFKDDKKKVFWYSKAAKAGLIDGQRDLGYSYFYGEGIKKDQTKAVYWYKKAAGKNDEKALYNLGLCYKHGDGVKQSNRWATYYFKRAAAFGHKAAKKELKGLV
jgi:uncharacterized protein